MTAKDVAWLWDMSLRFLYDQRRYIRGLDTLLQKHGVKKVLDCSCGVSFPAIGLKKLGYDVTCTDGSSEMVKRAKMNAAEAGVDLDFAVLNWQRLSKRFNSEFDAVLCRGNSLPYAVSWGRVHPDLSKARKTIFSSIKEMHTLLRPGGILYVDAALRETFSPKHETSIRRFRARKIDGKPTQLILQTTHDLKKHIRDWSSTVIISDPVTGSVKKHTMRCLGYHLPHGTLLCFLRSAGFSRIERYVNIAGEKNYDVFLARK